MLEWSTKRKLQYFAIIVGFLLVFVVLPFYAFIYTPPSCFDGQKNGRETGVDCGGSCQLLCPAEALSPVLKWDPRIFRVAPDTYNLLAYVDNPNVTAEVLSAPYTFKIYDREGIKITERSGVTYIPRSRTFAVFDGNFFLGGKVPFRVTFDFGDLSWTKVTRKEPEITIRNKALMRENTQPRVEAVIENRSLDRVHNIELIVVIFDSAGNAIATSRTFVERLDKGQSVDVFFTWPQPFEAKTEICSAPVDVTLVIDRSGSMRSLGVNPLQPLTDVKTAAILFVNQLSPSDQGALVSFATEASDPIDFTLSSDFGELKEAIGNINILSNGIQQTNIGEGLLKAKEELESERHKSGSGRVAVLLTDGVATHPEKEGDPKYPEDFALEVARQARLDDISIFTIGLGKEINQDFLKSVASSTREFYQAPTTRELTDIYREIATKICQKRPAIIEIVPRIYPN